jgi:hypothetical protein
MIMIQLRPIESRAEGQYQLIELAVDAGSAQGEIN